VWLSSCECEVSFEWFATEYVEVKVGYGVHGIWSDVEDEAVAPVGAGDITESVIRRFDACPDPRLREIMQAFVEHLHGFISQVELTPEEWTAAIRILTATGDITNEHRQEFILWSDTLGVSMLVDALANRLPAGATESTVLGPFYVPGSPVRAFGESMLVEGSIGTPAWVHGRVLDTEGQPIAGAELDLWQNDADMLYAVQKQEGPEDHLRGRYRTREDGSFAFIAVRPVPYPIPDDGPVGRMLNATGRHPWRPAHIHAIVRAVPPDTLERSLGKARRVFDKRPKE